MSISCGVSTRSHPESSKPAAAAGGLRGSGGEGPGGGGVARENPTQIELFVKTRLSFGAPSQHRGREDELAGTEVEEEVRNEPSRAPWTLT